MAIRQNILDNLRLDLLTIDGTGSYTNTISNAYKTFKEIEQIPKGGFDACYVGAGQAVKVSYGDSVVKWELPVAGIVYFKTTTDSTNQGLLETKAETIIEDLEILDESWALTLASLDVDSEKSVEEVEIVSIAPYINLGLADTGIVYFEIKITYYR